MAVDMLLENISSWELNTKMLETVYTGLAQLPRLHGAHTEISVQPSSPADGRRSAYAVSPLLEGD